MKKKVWLVSVGVAPVALIAAGGLMLYLALHWPVITKPMVEWGLARALQVSVTVDRVVVANKPYRLMLQRLRLDLDPKAPENYLEIGQLAIRCDLTGGFGNRTLQIESLTVQDFGLNLDSNFNIPESLRSSFEAPSDVKSSSKFLSALWSFLAFRQVRLESAVIMGGNAVRHAPQQQIAFSDIHLRYDQTSAKATPLVSGSLALSIDDRQRNLKVLHGLLELQASMTSSEKGATIKGQFGLTAPRAVFKEAALVDFNGRSQFTFDLEKSIGKITGCEFHSRIEDLGHGSGRAAWPRSMDLKLATEILVSKGVLNLGTWEFKLGDLGRFQGRLTGQWREPVRFEALVDEGWISLEALNPLLASRMREQSLQVELKHKVDLKGRIELRSEQGNLQWEGGVTLDFNHNPYRLQTKTCLLRGSAGGRFVIGLARSGAVKFSGTLASHGTDISTPTLDLKALEAGLRFQSTYPNIRLKEFLVTIPAAELPIASRKLKLEKVAIKAVGGRWNLNSSSGRLPFVEIQADPIKSIALKVDYTPSEAIVSLKSDDSGMLSALKGLKIIPEQWQVEAGETWRAKGVFKSARNLFKWRMSADLKDLSLANPDQSILVDKGAVHFSATGRVGLDNRVFEGHVAVEADSGEVLLDRFYLNLADHAFSLSGQLDHLFSQQITVISKGLLRVGGVGRVEFDAERNLAKNPMAANIHLRVPAVDIAPLYELAVKEPFELENPILGNVSVSGKISGQIEVRPQANQLEIVGRCSWQDGAVAVPEKNISLKEIGVDFPVWMLIGTSDESRARRPMQGTVSVDKMKLPLLADQPLRLPLKATPNRLVISKEISLATAKSGEIRFNPIELKFEQGKGLEMNTGLVITDWVIDAGLERFWPSQKEVTLAAHLDSVQLRQNHLTTKGRITTNLFGGKLLIQNPKIEAIFSSAPVLGADVKIQNMNLAALTDQTNFGKIDGVLQGSIKEFELVEGQPQHFLLQLETVRKRGVDQKISVEAVDNIARIGGGQSPFVGLAGNIATLFKRFDYRKIGVKASLENDMFRVNGLIHDKGVEYLVKKSGLSGVDIVNSNPDNRIGFKDMVKRVRRVLSPNTPPVVQ